MSTTYTLDPTTGTPDRRASSSLEPRTAASSQRSMRTFVKIFLVSAAAATVLQALLSIHIEDPSTKDGRCTFANPQNSLNAPIRFTRIKRAGSAHPRPAHPERADRHGLERGREL
jgi:hypothetical protein